MQGEFIDIIEWLSVEPDPKSELEYNEDGSAYIPIWKIEDYLDKLCEGKWSRPGHKYSFHTILSTEWLATSHDLEVNYAGMKRILLCSSFINTLDYSDSKNILQAGVAEATKAGCKVLGARFGKNLNDRNILKPKIVKERAKAKPDDSILKAYWAAFNKNDMSTMKRLTTIYDIKTEEIHAT